MLSKCTCSQLWFLNQQYHCGQSPCVSLSKGILIQEVLTQQWAPSSTEWLPVRTSGAIILGPNGSALQCHSNCTISNLGSDGGLFCSRLMPRNDLTQVTVTDTQKASSEEAPLCSDVAADYQRVRLHLRGEGVKRQPVTKRKYLCGLFRQLSRLLFCYWTVVVLISFVRLEDLLPFPLFWLISSPYLNLKLSLLSFYLFRLFLSPPLFLVFFSH